MFFKGSLLLKLSVDNLNCSTRFKTSAERKILQNMRFSMFISSQPIWGGRGCCLYWDLISLFVIYILFARKLLYALCFGAVGLCTNCVHYALEHYALMHFALLQYACALTVCTMLWCTMLWCTMLWCTMLWCTMLVQRTAWGADVDRVSIVPPVASYCHWPNNS